MSLTVENIQSIARLRYNHDITPEDVPIEMIQIAINSFQGIWILHDSILSKYQLVGVKYALCCHP